MTKDELEQDNDTFQPIGLTAARLVKSLDVSESAKPYQLGGTVGGSCGLGGIKPTDRRALAVDPDRSAPFPAASLEDYTHEPATIRGGTTVAHILRPRSRSEVLDPIISGIAIGVIDHIDGPISVDVKPNHAMGEIVFLMDHDYATTSRIEIASDAPDEVGHVVCRSLPPNEIASFGHVMQQPPDFFSGYDAAPMREICHAGVLETCEQQKEERERDAQREREDKEKAEQHRRAVDQGLRDIAAFEERAAGLTRRKRF